MQVWKRGRTRDERDRGGNEENSRLKGHEVTVPF